nr:NUDIX hydrolase [Streptococcus thermophilus]
MEQVVLCDDEGRPTGTADKFDVHTADTPLHLAFSAWLFDDSGRLLISRRALGKKTWPGVWTNSFCGHPAPGEATEAAVVRRAQQELGLPASALADLRCVLPDFRYRAVDSSGIVEHEICPVYVVRLASGAETGGAEAPLEPNPGEVDMAVWVNPADLITAVEAMPAVFSPWLVEELARPELRAVLEGQ